MKVLKLLTERRIWIALLNGVMFLLSFLHVEYSIDVPLLSELLTNAGLALVNIVTALLALWSFFSPKKAKDESLENSN